ncbi:MAG: pyridoxal-phosphate dependent enzyme [Flavobacteriales bacterium]|jgi:1-aminocyclopropane-1-carboxylate deaminase|nr:pyridoxal-phosphate dependent enzyme [Flavobacteriales bacterium]
MKIETHEIFNSMYKDANVKVSIKRLDLIDSEVSGNKYFKLKYNIEEAISKSFDTVLTFGGAFSNHILATSIIANNNNLSSIGVIRGEEHSPLNNTLQKAVNNGMKLVYISRNKYKLKESKEFLSSIKNIYGNPYIIPEGGTNKLAIKGASNIINNYEKYDYICCPVGTGGTISGIINASDINQHILGFVALGGYKKLQKDIALWTNKDNWTLVDKYNFGGYAKFNEGLVDFIDEFYLVNNIPLDLMYTAKMVYGVDDLIKRRKIADSSVLIIHTGGLQGNVGMNDRFNLHLPII